MNKKLATKPTINVDVIKSINNIDLADLCNITEQAIKAGGGFGWLKVPPRDVLNKYWRGALLVPNRKLIVGRLNNVIAGSLQLIFQPLNNSRNSSKTKGNPMILGSLKISTTSLNY